jgi:hypothetical protein
MRTVSVQGRNFVSSEWSAFFSVEILLERLQKDVLISPPLGSSQRAKPDVGAVIHFKRQGNGLVFGWTASLSASGVRLRPAG